MADYIRNIPNGTMMIRDTGGWVEFWFKTGAHTWNYQQTWGYGANGQYYQGDFRLEKNGLWHKAGAVFVGNRQDVLFRLFGEGLGWPTTDFVQFIERGRVPDPPYAPRIIDRNTNAIRVALDYGYDGGFPIDTAEIWWSYDTRPRYLLRNTRDAWVSGLSPKSTYYFWGKTHNERGWSDFSGRSSSATSGVPDKPQPPLVKTFSPTTALGSIRTPLPWDGGSRILEWQIGFGLDPNAPQVLNSGLSFARSDFQPGKQYYFWARARNATGWSSWSGRTNILFPAGAFVKQNGVWKRALPWVKVNGVWQVAEPKIKSGVAWKSPRA